MEKLRLNFNKYLTIVIYAIVSFVFTDLLKNILVNAMDDVELISMLLNLVPYLITFTSVVILLRSEIKTDFNRVKKFDCFMMFKICLMGIISGYFANMLGSTLSSLFGGGGQSANQQGVEQLIVGKYGFIFFIIVVFIGPIVEELVFRKAIHGALRNLKLPNGLILFISSCLFGLIHVLNAGDFVYIFPYIFMGFVFGGLELQTRSVFPSMIVHIFNNAVSFLLTLILGAIGPLLPQI